MASTVLDHPGHRVVPAPHHPSVPGGVGELGGQQGGGGVGRPVLVHQRGQGGRTQQGRVAGQDHHVAVVARPRRRAVRSGPPTWRPRSPAAPPAPRTRWPCPAGRARSASWSPTRPGGRPPPPPGSPTPGPARRARGGPWVGRTAGGGAWAGPSASGSPRRRPAPPPTAADRGPRDRPVRPGVRPGPRTVVPLVRRLLGVGPDHHGQAPLPMAPGTSAPSVTRCTGHGPILPTSARPMRPGRRTTGPTAATNRAPQPATAVPPPPHPCPSSPPPSTRTRTPSGPTPAP